MRCAISDLMNPLDFSNPSKDFVRSFSSPKTVTYTVAKLKSPVTSTSVTVTKPTFGFLTSG